MWYHGKQRSPRPHPFLTAAGLGTALALALALPSGAAAADAPAAEHDRAVALARGGDNAAALAILERLARAYPGDLGVARDRVVISVWAGRDADAVRLYEQLPRGEQPDYVLAAAARAYRNLHRYPEALELYRNAHRRFPKDAGIAAGEIETLADSGDAPGAVTLAETVLKVQGEAAETLLAAAYAAEAARRPAEALRYTDRALARDPRNREAKRMRILAIEALGAPALALKLAEAEPGLFAPEALRRLEGSAAAQRVRWDTINQVAEAHRFDEADRSIAALDALIARWSRESGSEDALWRARFDRLIALHDRHRMAEVVGEYEAARRSGIAVPPYVLSDVAGAFLTLRQPEAARDLYRQALAADPGNIEIELGLFHALIETEEFDAAFAEVDTAEAEREPWLHFKGVPDVTPNSDRLEADVAAALARYYADELPEAEQRLRTMSESAPNNATLLTDLATVELGRGWPRQAGETLERARAQQPDDADIDIAQARIDLARQDWHPFETEVESLARRLPENTDVQRLVIEDDLYHRAVLHLFADRAWASATSVNGGNGLTEGAKLYSPPFLEDWRLFSGYRQAHQRLPEGMTTERVYDSGVEYRANGLSAEGGGRLADYGPQSLGAHASAEDWLNDHWQLGGGGEIFADDTPIRALKHHITANAASASALYRESESRAVKTSAEALLFSDGNFRTSLGTVWRERLLTLPHLRLNALTDLGVSRNSRRNEPYFNPSMDALASSGVEVVQVLYRRYELIYEHAFTAVAGPYWEEHFGTGLAWSARYEQRVRSDLTEAGLALGFARQPYDGVYENAITLSFNLTWRF